MVATTTRVVVVAEEAGIAAVEVADGAAAALAVEEAVVVIVVRLVEEDAEVGAASIARLTMRALADTTSTGCSISRADGSSTGRTVEIFCTCKSAREVVLCGSGSHCMGSAWLCIAWRMALRSATALSLSERGCKARKCIKSSMAQLPRARRSRSSTCVNLYSSCLRVGYLLHHMPSTLPFLP